MMETVRTLATSLLVDRVESELNSLNLRATLEEVIAAVPTFSMEVYVCLIVSHDHPPGSFSVTGHRRRQKLMLMTMK